LLQLRPTGDNLGPDGRFRPAAELRARLADLPDDATVGVYCGSGVTAAHEIAALQIAGIDAVLFPGSWSAWSADPDRPVATGSQPGWAAARDRRAPARPSAISAAAHCPTSHSHACSLNYQDNVAVQEAVRPRRRTDAIPGESSWLVHYGVTTTRALPKADMPR
jgi:hypothetical protein